tara:strand:- start:54 stop:158 length:105 start_codon:yes stop_codon:yes gene_type:complete
MYALPILLAILGVVLYGAYDVIKQINNMEDEENI